MDRPPLRIAITGASGRVARELIPRLARSGHRLHLGDAAEIPHDIADHGDLVARLNLSDVEGHISLFESCDVVVHLGGISGEQDWASIVSANITGTRNVFEAAAATTTRTVIFGSSIHAAGMLPVSEVAKASPNACAPDGYYGVSKLAGEALGALYASRHGLRVISTRICTFGPTPEPGRGHATWLAPEDFVRLIEASTDAPAGHHVIWGVSANDAAWFPLDAGHKIGYFPVENAASFPDDTLLPSQEALIGGFATEPHNPIGQPW